jgi:Flp pilus assembly pilin Flp
MIFLLRVHYRGRPDLFRLRVHRARAAAIPSPTEEPMILTRSTFETLLSDETAAGLIEYVLLAALIALAAVFAMHNFGKKLTKDYKQITRKI